VSGESTDDGQGEPLGETTAEFTAGIDGGPVTPFALCRALPS
jgi:hypothetical protein